MIESQVLRCPNSGEWVKHVYPNAPAEYWTIRCTCCGARYETFNGTYYLKVTDGKMSLHRVAPDAEAMMAQVSAPHGC